MDKKSKRGSRFLATFTNDYSKLSVAIPIAKKSQVVGVVRNMVAQLELQSGKKLKAVRTDRGSEFLNEGMAASCGKKGIPCPSIDGKVFTGAKWSRGEVEPGANGAGTGDAH
jgi:hypothetical protein